MKRNLFEIKSKESNDTLFVSTPFFFNYTSIGINTYKETIENIIRISSNKNIIIQEVDNLTFKGEFAKLKVNNSRKTNYQSIKKSETKILKCTANKNLIINGELKKNDYEFRGLGINCISLDANKIKIDIH